MTRDFNKRELEAYRRRAGMIGRLQACTGVGCAWPLEIAPTVTGHAAHCQVEQWRMTPPSSEAAIEVRELDQLAGVELRHVVANTLNTNLEAANVHLPRGILDGIADQVVTVVVAVIGARPRIARGHEHEQNNIGFDQLAVALHDACSHLMNCAAAGPKDATTRLVADAIETVLPTLRSRLP